LQRRTSLPKCDFERILLEAVDEGLSSLGESSKVAVYFHLQKNFNVRREEIPCNVGAFADAMEKIFGQGASFLEILIMKRLHEKVREAARLKECEDFTFTEYIASARRSLLRKDGV
jgi:hypothetical protein